VLPVALLRQALLEPVADAAPAGRRRLPATRLGLTAVEREVLPVALLRQTLLEPVADAAPAGMALTPADSGRQIRRIEQAQRTDLPPMPPDGLTRCRYALLALAEQQGPSGEDGDDRLLAADTDVDPAAEIAGDVGGREALDILVDEHLADVDLDVDAALPAAGLDAKREAGIGVLVELDEAAFAEGDEGARSGAGGDGVALAHAGAIARPRAVEEDVGPIDPQRADHHPARLTTGQRRAGSTEKDEHPGQRQQRHAVKSLQRHRITP
jgi:hypothetical protein